MSRQIVRTASATYLRKEGKRRRKRLSEFEVAVKRREAKGNMRPCSSVLIFLHWVLFPVTSRALFSTRQSATLHRTISSASRTLPEIVAIDRTGRSSCHEALYLSAKEGGEPQDQEITDLNLEQMFEVFEAADSAVPATEGGMKTTVSALRCTYHLYTSFTSSIF